MFNTYTDISDEKIIKNVAGKFPSFRNQYDGSNNQKLLAIKAELYNRRKQKLIDVYNLTRIDTAKGVNLTDLAKDYHISRIDDDDDFLRFEIRWQILKSRTPTTMNGLKTLISALLKVDIHEFDVVGTDRPQELKINNIPFNFDHGSHSDLKRKILANAIQTSLPANYVLAGINFYGQSQQDIYVGYTSHLTIYKETGVTNLATR